MLYNNQLALSFSKKIDRNESLPLSYMRKCKGEFVDHLLLHCSIASDLWSMILGLLGVFFFFFFLIGNQKSYIKEGKKN